MKIRTRQSEQAFVLSFNGITWLNFRGDSKVRKWPVTAVPARLAPRPATAESRTFLISSVTSSTGYSPNECPRLKGAYGIGLFRAAVERGRGQREDRAGGSRRTARAWTGYCVSRPGSAERLRSAGHRA